MSQSPSSRPHNAGPSGKSFNQALLLAIQEASPDGILVVNENSEVVSYNERFLNLWKFPDRYISDRQGTGSPIPDSSLLQAVSHQVEDPEAFIQRVNELYNDPSARDHSEIALKDGRTIERHSSPLFDGDRYLGRVWFFRDITKPKTLERRLRELAWYDSLTHSMNRRHFLSRAAQELERSRRTSEPLAILMLDLDHFKAVNDQYGHAAGDSVLRKATRAWRQALRSIDLMGRLGGEEFAVLLPGTDLEAARAVAERLRNALDNRPTEWKDQDVHCTVSIGVSAFHGKQDSVQGALSRADQALYRAKANGRNRVEIEP